MAESPHEFHGTRAVPERVGTELDHLLPRLAAPPVPRVVVKADLLPAVSAVSLIALLGLPAGWVWSRLAPPQQSVLGPNGSLTPLLVESYHGFDAIAIFALLTFGLGLLTSSVLWWVRRRRGPVLLIAGALGSLVASWLGVQMGVSFASGLYPMPTNPQLGDLIAVAPEIGTNWVLLAQPLALALGYGLAASWNGLDDLGRRLP
ncbi:Protein of unknown function [Saccharopolyspora kobensis]|uniref:DUF2567 domain-containing protein n=1 Tax=Saccharopolyspora kobensis TaxID=146035 RepID=A0A1H6C1Y4_9PSEU|nr:DUF2567 domain-containing protein [Saccharopolyspora kobensis]SEG66665.1 Protein of unknown function [Saccharopolyspora kobensis]SFC23684.1 Protein of unknown function [Saccharopolyspora kobensis]